MPASLLPVHRTRPAGARLLAATASALIALTAAGCGDDDATTTGAAPPAETTRTTDTQIATGPINGEILPPATSTTVDPDGTTVVTAESTDPSIVRGIDRGVAIALEPSSDGPNPGAARGVVTVTRRAPLSVRRTLARRAGYLLDCDVAGAAGSQGAGFDAKGSRTATAVGTVYRTGGFLTPAKGRTIRDTVRSCSLHLADERRGSSSQTTTAGDPAAAFLTVRFR